MPSSAERPEASPREPRGRNRGAFKSEDGSPKSGAEERRTINFLASKIGNPLPILSPMIGNHLPISKKEDRQLRVGRSARWRRKIGNSVAEQNP